MSTLILFIIVILFLLIVSVVGGVLAWIGSIVHKVKNLGKRSQTDNRQSNGSRVQEGNGDRVIGDDEGEYIDFEEVKE